MDKCFLGKTTNGENVWKYTLRNEYAEVELINYGASVYSIKVPDKNHILTDITLMPETLSGIENNKNYMGAAIGRYSNRIRNSRFTLNGIEYTLSSNDNSNSHHGGISAFDKKVWKAVEYDNSVEFKYFSKDGEEGYPGNLNVSVNYSLVEKSIVINFKGYTDKDTPLSMTNHCYFNLNGHHSGTVSNHTLKLNSKYYLPVDSSQAVTGEILKTENTEFDFLEKKKLTNYYDHCFVINDSSYLKYAGTLYGDISEISMSVYTTYPGLHIYKGKSLATEITGKCGKTYMEDSFVCTEAEFFPNSPNLPHFPTTILKANDLYNHKIIYKFN